METIAISAIVGAIFFVLGLISGKCSPCNSGADLLGKLSSLETKVYVLEQENKRLNYVYENMSRGKRMFHEYMMSHCSICHKDFYAKAPKEQDVADMLKSITLTSEEIAKKLDIRIK